jgi:hypothetical protein
MVVQEVSSLSQLELEVKFSVYQITARYYLLVSYSSLLDADTDVSRVPPTGVVFLSS